MAYNGHRSKAYWNVALWINNDEGLYRMAQSYIRRSRTKVRAARAMFAALTDVGITKTPDGHAYSPDKILRAMYGIEGR